jgi:hypothetical protein
VFVEQTGTNNLLNGVDVGYNATPVFVDIDGDSDMDAFIGASDGTVKFFENMDVSSSPALVQQTGAGNPLNGVSGAYVEYNIAPAFVDIDGDGDMDAFVGGEPGVVRFFENTGGSSSPAFTEQTGTGNPLNGEDVLSSAAPAFVDIDGDGDVDAFVGEAYGTVKFFENRGSGSTPAFATTVFANVSTPENAAPVFVDINADGDLDIFIGTKDDGIHYFENRGTKANGDPIYVERTGPDNPLWLVGEAEYTVPIFGDIDGDGDMDAFVGNYSEIGFVRYFENKHTDSVSAAGSPLFVELTDEDNPLGFISAAYGAAPALADIDGDGDLDAFVGGKYDDPYDGTIRYFENMGDDSTPNFQERLEEANPLGEFSFIFNDAPAFADIDGDGDLDVVVGNYTEGGESDNPHVRYFENRGSAASPAFVEQTGRISPLDITANDPPGYVIHPTLADIDGDGSLDLVVGDYYGQLHFLKGIPTRFAELSGEDNPLGFIGNSVPPVKYASPAFADIDGDGDLDAVIGGAYGEGYAKLRYFENQGSDGSGSISFTERTGDDNPVDIDFPPAPPEAHPAFADIDGDGDPDLFVGDFSGALRYFRNTGPDENGVSQFEEKFGLENPFGFIGNKTLFHPAFGDIDGDGDLDAVLGDGYSETSPLRFFKNTGNPLSPGFVEQYGPGNPFGLIAFPNNSCRPALADIDGDGDLDAFVGTDTSDGYGEGEQSAYARYFENTGSATAPAFMERTGEANPLWLFNGSESYGAWTAPTFADINGDGDLDAFVGGSNNVRFFENLVLWAVLGDVNGDGNADLSDAMLSLQVQSGIVPAVPVTTAGDVNGDGRVGMPETMFDLQKEAGLRKPRTQ